jgi:ABC-type Fe3+/spermidine/putrescine transport system ATPase subunit
MEEVARKLASAIPAAGEVLVRLSDVSMTFGRTVALHPVDLEIRRGDFFALLGPSGCGKTTLLKTIGGFLAPTTGRVEIGGLDVTRLPPEKRRTGMVFQGYGLFPHMSVRQNIAYGLRVARRPVAEIDRRVDAMIALVRLGGMEDRLPAALSGGQQQRVALARSLVMEPAVLLLDEPLAALDLSLRKAMQEELRSLHRSIGGTFVFVTHDQHEAMAMANRIAVMKDGRIVQQGTPQEIYAEPRSEFVAGFIGDANLLRGARRAGVVTLETGATLASPGPDGTVAVVVRPDHLAFAEGATLPLEAVLKARCEDIVFLGTHVRLDLRTAAGAAIAMHVPPFRMVEHAVAVGQEFAIGWTAGGRRIVEAGA